MNNRVKSNMRIEDCGLSEKTVNTLKGAGFTYLDEVFDTEKSSEQNRKLSLLGRKALEEILALVKEQEQKLEPHTKSEGELVMTKGRQKCEFFKQIRKDIAKQNGIVYLTSECDFQGECAGTCLKCDAEVRYLQSELDDKVKRNEKVTLAGISLEPYPKR